MQANILRLLSAEALEKILQVKFECETLDFKETLDLSSRRDRLELARDILAMANTLGGFIVIGVEDATFEVVGIPEHLAAHFEDGPTVNNALEKVLGNHVIVHATTYNVHTSDGRTVIVALLFVPPREITSPMLPAPVEGNYEIEVNGKKQQKIVFYEGELLVRKADSSRRVKTSEDLQRKAYNPDMNYLDFKKPFEEGSDVFTNPYNIAVAARDRMFKGRQEEIRKILGWISTGNHIAVYGLQRVGKTSLVQQVFQEQMWQPHVRNKIRFASINLQELGSDHIKQKQFLDKIAEAIVSALSDCVDERTIKYAFDTYFEDKHYKLGDQQGLFTGFRKALETVVKYSKKNIVIFLDEFSELCRSIERNDQLMKKPTYRIEKTHPHDMYINIPFMKQFSSLLKSTALHQKLTGVDHILI